MVAGETYKIDVAHHFSLKIRTISKMILFPRHLLEEKTIGYTSVQKKKIKVKQKATCLTSFRVDSSN